MTSSEPALTSRELAAELRLHFAEHNRRVLFLALSTLVVAAILWAGLYFIAQWLTLLAVTVIGDGTAPIPRGFSSIFATAAAALLAYAWVDRLLTPDDRPRDKKTPGEITQDIVLAIPRATFAIWSTLTARQRLSDGELAQASELLQHLTAVERLPLHAAGYDLPDPAAREKVLFALQLTRVIDIHHGKNSESTISLSAQRPDSLRLTAR